MSINLAEQKKIEGVMMSLMKELQELAPHPNQRDETAPLFVRIDSQHKPAAEYDGMLGSMVLESFLGAAFTEACTAHAASCPQTFFNYIDPLYIAEVASEYAQERSSDGKYNIGQKKALAAHFNSRATWKSMMGKYLKDLPRRLGIERWLAEHQRKLYALQKNAPVPSL